jgi:16S rRNA A1518/A1519 N6-dimethyltransferase RsmA/KsgA/DIM1 with predicted DNA glycosylase/AP lyase activity
MNLAHRCLCRSKRWKNTVETHIVPWVLEGVDLGSNILEIGPGAGVTTDLLRGRVKHLTCVEIDRS